MSFNKSDYAGRGISGLANLGNTCFINSSIQVLSHTYEFTELINLSDEALKKKLNNQIDSVLLLEWLKLLRLMWSKNCIIAPRAFCKAIRIVATKKDAILFTGFLQNDAAEFLLFIIDCFHNALKREVEMVISGKTVNKTDEVAVKCYSMIKNMYSKEYSEIVKLFYGTHVSMLKSMDTDELISSNPEPYFMIDLPIPPTVNKAKEVSLLDCFDEYIKPEILDGDNKVYNEKTKKKESMAKNIMFWSMPNILIIDSIQTLTTSSVDSMQGTITQLKTCTAELINFGKRTSIPILLIGHINKDGNIAGPKVLEHMVDTVLQFEGDRNHLYRI